MSEQHNPRASADQRLIANKVAMTGALATLSALQGYEFDRALVMGDKPSVREIGLVTDEVQAILPEAVTVEGPYRVKHHSQDALIALLVEAVKELKAQVDAIPVTPLLGTTRVTRPVAPVDEVPL